VVRSFRICFPNKSIAILTKSLALMLTCCGWNPTVIQPCTVFHHIGKCCGRLKFSYLIVF